MTDIRSVFARLGLEQYVDSFIVEGFDSWETVLDIQEGDLDALNVKLGHRRKLQREIATQRGIFYERSYGSPTTETSGEVGRGGDPSPSPTEQSGRSGTETKRKYRRHPNPDKNAPERPPSAYVIFSNNIREEVRGQNLSFTDIAKLVGDRWQKLTPEEKEPFESQAHAFKERFKAELALYKKTDAYKEYIQYVADFKSKHSDKTSDAKRAKVEQDSSDRGGRSKLTGIIAETRPNPFVTRTRDISMGLVGPTPYHESIPSPPRAPKGPPVTMAGYSISPHLTQGSSSPPTSSPPLRNHERESRISPALPVDGSATPEGQHMQEDVPELRSRASQLSLTPLSTTVVSPNADQDLARRVAARFPPPLLQYHSSSVSSVAHSDSSGASYPLPVTPANERWRYLSAEEKSRCSEFPRFHNPPLSNIHPASSGAPIPLPALERAPVNSLDPSQRTLPLPAPSSAVETTATSREHAQYPAALLPQEASAGGLLEPRSRLNIPENSPEDDAANVLALLPYTRRRSRGTG